jgi:hypothetical protein
MYGTLSEFVVRDWQINEEFLFIILDVSSEIRIGHLLHKSQKSYSLTQFHR